MAQGADHERIRRAYLDAARKWHPDRLGSASEAEAAAAETAMREVNEAWSVLRERDSRAAYDRQLAARSSPFGEAESRLRVDRPPSVANRSTVARPRVSGCPA